MSNLYANIESLCFTAVALGLLTFCYGLVLSDERTSARELDMRKTAIESGKCETIAPTVPSRVTFGPCR